MSLKEVEVLLTLVAETKAFELLTLSSFGFLFELVPTDPIQSSDTLLELTAPVSALFPLGRMRNATAIA